VSPCVRTRGRGEPNTIRLHRTPEGEPVNTATPVRAADPKVAAWLTLAPVGAPRVREMISLMEDDRPRRFGPLARIPRESIIRRSR
jgi:hypothetical protein